VRNERTSVGLDVHARSVVGCAVDELTGEIHRRRLTPDPNEILGWVRSLPAPARVAYEAGPTGFGLARFLCAQGVECLVAAPSKLQRPSGDRVKTDARDALHLARLLKLDEIVAVRVPGVAQEAARDLVRAREDARADLMRTRHRLSKLLLRQGIVYSGGQAWTGKHDAWLRSHSFAQPGLQLAYESGYEAMLVTAARRDRLDAAIVTMAGDSEFTDVVHRLCCLRGVSTLTGFALAVEIGDWHRFTGSSIGAYLGLVPNEQSSGATRSQGSITKTATGMPDGCWSRRPGITARPTATLARSCGPAGRPPRRRPGSAARGESAAAPTLADLQ
jgi:transposase